MIDDASPWLRIVMLATALVFVGVAVYVFGFAFTARLHPDDTTIVLLADKALRAKSPVVTDWYYANREIWVIGPHLLALVPVAIAGVSKAALWISLVIGFAFQLTVLAASYRRLAQERWLLAFATIVTSIAWSHDHISFEYVQLAYGFATCMYLLAFTSFATLSRRAFVLGAFVVAVLAIQSPARTLIFMVLPVLVACAWPWREASRRDRAMIAASALAGWVVAFGLYKLVLVRVVTFSFPAGYATLALADIDQIPTNLRWFGDGMIALCGGDDSLFCALPGMAVLAGALALVAHEVFASRAFTARRFTSTVILLQLGAVVVPMVFGTLMSNATSVRYLMPSLLSLVGLAVLIAVDALRVQGWLRHCAVGWLVAVPVAALAAVPDARPQEPDPQLRPDAAAIKPIARALEQRGLHRGFAANLVASLLTVESSGDVVACPITLWHAMIPQRWLTSTDCFDRAKLPARFFVVAGRSQVEREAIHTTLGDPLERFAAGPTYDVYVFAAANTDPAWLDLPIRDGREAVFPLRIAANNLQLLHDNATLDHGELVSTGDGIMVYGPYISLPRGRYRVTWRGRALDARGKLSVAVNADGGKESLNWIEMPASSLPREVDTLATRDVLLKTRRERIELVVQLWDGARIALDEIVIERR